MSPNLSIFEYTTFIYRWYRCKGISICLECSLPCLSWDHLSKQRS